MRKLLIPFLTAGHPEPTWFEPLLKAMDRNGADFIEIGVPFSDPIADGPAIQAASQRALANGVTARWIVEEVRHLRPQIRADLIFFSYFNPLNALAPSLEEAARLLERAGFHGVLVPDLALEEAGPLIAALQAANLHYIPLIAPTTPESRIQTIAPHTTSFGYGVSVAGVTGVRKGVASGLEGYLSRVRRHLKRFVVGFGISTPEDAAAIGQHADGVVIGSAIIKMLGESQDVDTAVKRVSEFLSAVRLAIDREP